MSETQAQQLFQNMQVLEQHFLDLSNTEQNILTQHRQVTNAIESLRSFTSQPESDTLIPIGGGVNIPAKIISTKNIILDIGANIAVERDIPSTISTLEINAKGLEDTLNKIIAKKEEIAFHIEQGRAQMEQLAAAQNPDQGM